MSQSRVKALSSRVRVNAPANSFRGGWVDTFRSTVLTQLLANINQQGSSAGWTYIDYAAGPDKWDISQSVRRQWGINPVFDYGRAMSVLRHKDERVFMGHPFLGLMRRVREVNSDVVHNTRTLGDKTTVSKLVPGFKYFPSTAALLKPIMREQDRAILCEKDPEYFHRLATYVGNDHRFKLWNLDAYEEIAVSETPHQEPSARISIPQKLRRGEKQLERFYAALEEREKELRDREPAVWEDPKLKKPAKKTPNPDVEAAKAEAERLVAAGLPLSDPAHVAFGEEIKAHNKQANDILRYLGILPPEAAPLTESVTAGAEFVDGAAASPLVPAPPVPQLTASREQFETQEEYELALRIIDLQRRIAEREVETFLRVQGVPTEKLRVSIERAHGLAPELFARQVEEAALTASTPASRSRLDLQRTIATLEAHQTILSSAGHWTPELRTLWNELSLRIDEANDTIHNPIYERIMDADDEPLSLENSRRADPLEDYSDERLAQLESLIPLDPHTHQLYTTFQAKLLQAEDRHKLQVQHLRDEIKLLKDEQKADLDKLRAAEPLRLDEQLALADLAALRTRLVANEPDAVAEVTARQRKVALAMAQSTAKEVAFARLPEELPALLGQPRQEVVTALFHGASRGALISVNSPEHAMSLLKDKTITSFGQLESALRPSENPRVVAARAAERKRFAELQSITQAYLKAKASGVPLEQLDAVAAPKELAAQAGAQSQAETAAHNAYLDQLAKYSRDTLAGWTKQADSLLSKGRAEAVAAAQKALEASVAPQQQARLKLVEVTLAQGPSAAAAVEAKAVVARLDAQTSQLLEAFREAIAPVSVACHDALAQRCDAARAEVLETELALYHANQALVAAQARLAEASGMGDMLTAEESEIKLALRRIDADDDATEELLKDLKAESQMEEEIARLEEDAREEAAALAAEAAGISDKVDMPEPKEDPEELIEGLRDETQVFHEDVDVMERRVEFPRLDAEQLEAEVALAQASGARPGLDGEESSGPGLEALIQMRVDQRSEGARQLAEEEAELDRMESEDAPEEAEDLPALVREAVEAEATEMEHSPESQQMLDLEDDLFDIMFEKEVATNGEEAAEKLMEESNAAGVDFQTYYAWFDQALAKYGLTEEPAAIELAKLRREMAETEGAEEAPQVAASAASSAAAAAKAKAGESGELAVEGEDDAVVPARRSPGSDDFLEDDESSSGQSAADEARAKRLENDRAAALKCADNPDHLLSEPVQSSKDDEEEVKLSPEEQAEFDAEAEVGEHELYVGNAARAVDAAAARLAAVEAQKAELALLATTPPATPAMQAAPGTRALSPLEAQERAHRLRYEIAKCLREIAALEADMQADRDSTNQYDFDIPIHHLHIVSQRRVDDLTMRVTRLQLELSEEPRDKLRLAKMVAMERPAELDTVEFDKLSEQYGLGAAQQQAVIATNELSALESRVGLQFVEEYEQWEKVTMDALLERAEVAKELRDQKREERLDFNAQLKFIQSVVDKQRAEAALLPASTGGNQNLADINEFNAELAKVREEAELLQQAEEDGVAPAEDADSLESKYQISRADEEVLARAGYADTLREVRDFDARLNREVSEEAEAEELTPEEHEQHRQNLATLYDALAKYNETVEEGAKRIAAEREALRTAVPFSDADLAQVRTLAAKAGVDPEAAVAAVRANFFGVLTAEGTVDAEATDKMLELHAILTEEMPALFAVADRIAEVNDSLLAEESEEELRAQLVADQKLDLEEITLDIANVPVEFRELHLAREKAALKTNLAAELMHFVRKTMVERRPDNEINDLLTDEDLQLIEDAEQAAQRSMQLAQAEVQKRIDASAAGLPDLQSLASRLPTDEEAAQLLEAAEVPPPLKTATLDGQIVDLVTEREDEFDEAEAEVTGDPVPESIRFEHAYLESMAKTEAIVRRKLLELQPLAFLDGEARVLQSRVDEMQSTLDAQHNARRAETIARWRQQEDKEDADLMASLAQDATGKALSIDAIEMTMFRRRTQGLSLAALEPVLAAKKQEEVKAVYKKAGEVVAARNKALGVLADALPVRPRPQLPSNPTPAEEREWQVAMSLYNKEVAQDKRMFHARRTQEATPEAFKMLRALKHNRNPELRRRQQLLASIEADALKPVAAKAKELGMDLPADYEQAVIAVRSASDDVREKLFPLIIEARTLMHTLRTESLDQMRVEMQSLQQQQRELQAKLSAAKWVHPRHDVVGKEMAAEKKKAAELEAQQLSEEMVLAGEVPPVVLSEQEQIDAEFQRKVEAQMPAALASLHIEEKLNEIGNDPLTYEARQLELELEARRIALEKAFPHVAKPDQPFILYSDLEQMRLRKAAQEDKAWGIIPPEGQPAEVESAATHFPVNLASALAKPLTAHAIIGIDIAEAITEGFGFEGDILGVDDLVLSATQQIIEQSVHRFPHATYVITYPIFGRGYQDQLLQAIMKTGVRNIIQGTFHIQKGEPFDTATRVYDFEPWGAGVAIIRPPPGFDKVLKDIVNTMQDVMIAYGPSIHSAEEQDAVASRVFPTVDAQANATFFVDRSIHWQDGWPNRPDVSWMTAQVEEHIKNLHSFRWEHFVPSYENPRSKRFELLARARSDLESDLWNYSKGYRGDDESANRWLLVNNQISTHGRVDTRDTKRVPPTKELRKSKDEAKLTAIMRQTAQARKELRAQIEMAQQRVAELKREKRVSDAEAQRAQFEAEAALASVEAQLKPVRDSLALRLAKVDPADTEAVALVRTEHAIQMLPLRKQKEELMARTRALGERRSDAEYSRLVADAVAEVQSLEAAEQELVVDADLRAEPVVESLQREQAVARSMGIEPTQLQLDGHGRNGTKLASPPRDQSKLKPSARYTASSTRPAIDPVDWGFVQAQKRALKRVQDADLAAARDQKRVSVFNMLSTFQRSKIEQQVESRREALIEAERIAQAKRDGTWLEEDEEAKKEEEKKKRRTPALHMRMAKDNYFQRALVKYGQKAHSQMVLPPKKQ